MESIMELDELKTAWRTLDRRLEQHNALSLQLFKDTKLTRARHGLRPLVWGQAIQMLIGALGMLWFAPFWVEHRHEIWLLLSGLTMHAYCLGLVVFGAVMQAQISHIDYTAPVLTIQRQLLTLRRSYVIGGMLIGLPWWFLTGPLLVVITQGVVLERAPAAVWLQFVIGAVGLLATWWFHRWANQPQRAAFGRKLDDGAAGGSIRRAQAALDELARFEQE
jgi:hypothetical protein